MVHAHMLQSNQISETKHFNSLFLHIMPSKHTHCAHTHTHANAICINPRVKYVCSDVLNGLAKAAAAARSWRAKIVKEIFILIMIDVCVWEVRRKVGGECGFDVRAGVCLLFIIHTHTHT